MEESASLARRYRPAGFEGYIGNQRLKEQVYQTLNAAQAGERPWPQTIMLRGFTGCGKTTMARIIMREYLCEDRDPVTGACGECTNCSLMSDYVLTGNFDNLPDISEVDIAQRSTKDEIKEVLEEMEQMPLGDWRFVYLDEVHRASEASQSALLKVYEEPPEHLVIIMATTDPDKILPTILNRTQMELQVQKPSEKELVAHLATICNIEGIPYDPEGLRIISRHSNRIIRAALNNLQQVASTYKSAEAYRLSDHFGVVEDSILFEFIDAWKSKNYVRYSILLYNASTKESLDAFVASLTSFVLRGIYIINGAEVDGLTPAEIKQYKSLFDRFDEADLAFMLSSLQRMDKGDIEANLMAFIYATPHQGVSPEVTKPPAQENVERRERRRNIDNTNDAHLRKLSDLTSGSVSTYSESELLSRLPAQKVRVVPNDASHGGTEG